MYSVIIQFVLGNQDDINNTSLNSGVEVLPPVKTTSMSNNLVSCLDDNEIDKVITQYIKTNYLALFILLLNLLCIVYICF